MSDIERHASAIERQGGRHRRINRARGDRRIRLNEARGKGRAGAPPPPPRARAPGERIGQRAPLSPRGTAPRQTARPVCKCTDAEGCDAQEHKTTDASCVCAHSEGKAGGRGTALECALSEPFTLASSQGCALLLRSMYRPHARGRLKFGKDHAKGRVTT